ncbi:MAG TPA: NAD(P)H-hydrate dehydratase [Kineosporiaceae bacterium]|nr:NAD(P)H-hydrate dehydratase [Kineosporiaceae bacterium]
MPPQDADRPGPRKGAQVVTPALLRGWPLPAPGDDKNDRGSVLVVGGAVRTPGAVLLAGLAALRAGAGKLQMAVAEPAAMPLAVAAPEALVAPLPFDPATGSVEAAAADAVRDLAKSADVVCIGPGLDDAERSGALVAGLLEGFEGDARVVLDAYALGALHDHPELGRSLPGRIVVTPNTQEAGILLDGDTPGTDEVEDAALEIARRYQVVVALRSAVADPQGQVWAGGSGQAGLGTSGSGDVLAGIVAGLLARGAEPAQAAIWGAYVHATAGERLAARVGPLGYLARELLDEAPAVLTELSVQY